MSSHYYSCRTGTRVWPAIAMRFGTAAVLLCTLIDPCTGQSTLWRDVPVEDRAGSELLQGLGVDQLCPTTPSTPRRFDEVNAEFDVPGRPWVELDLKRGDAMVRLMLLDPTADRCVILILERLGVEMSVDNGKLMALAQAQLRRRAPDAAITNEREESAGDFQGVRCEATGTVNGRPNMHVVLWVTTAQGFAYQVIVIGERMNAAAHDKISREFRQRLRQIEPTRIARVEDAELVSRFESPQFGYRVDLRDSSWFTWKDIGAKMPGAEFGAASAGPKFIAVVPVPMPHRVPDPDALTKAMLGRMNFGQPTDEYLGTTVYKTGAFSGQEVEARRVVGPHEFRYCLRIVADDRCAYLLAGWVLNGDPATFAQLRQAMDRITLYDRDPPEAAALAASQRVGCGLVLNDLGLASYARGDHLTALDYFSNAFRFYPSDEAVLTNYVGVLFELDRTAEALTLLKENADRFPNSLLLRTFHAKLLCKEENYDAARKVYAEVFAAGHTDESALFHYIGLCTEAEAYDEAIAAVEAVLQRKPTLVVQRWHAGLYGSKGDFAKSIAMFKSLRERYGSDQYVALDLAYVYEQAKEFTAGLEITQELLDAGKQDEPTLVAHGRLQLHLERYGEAKQTLERALANFPNSEEVKELLSLASSQLGEGDNSCLKTPIGPVEIPPVVREAMASAKIPSDSALQEQGAEELSRVLGLSFEPDEPLRTTVSRRIKVHTAGGVSRFSTLSFSLDPTRERFFVNRLVVLNEQNEQVAEGSIENYYAVDDNSSGVASNAKIVNLPVPGLKPGYTLECTVTREDLSAAKDFPFQEIILSSYYPVRVSAFFVKGDVAKLRWAASTAVAVQTTENLLYCLQQKPTVIRHEPNQPAVESFVPTVWVSASSTTWEAEGRAYLDSIKAKLLVDEQTRKLAVELTRGCRTQREKLAAIAAYVQQAYTYQAIEFGRRARIPNTAAKTIELKYGDCKDHAVLVKLLLEGAGIPSHLALFKVSGDLVHDLPSLDQFDHMIVYVPTTAIGGAKNAMGGLIVDATDKNADPLLVPPYGMGDKTVFVLDPSQPRVVRTPSYPSDGGRLISQRRVTLLMNESRGTVADAHVHEQVTLNSYLAPGMRAYLKLFEPGRRREAIQNLLSQGESVRVQRFEVENLEKPSEPLILSLEYVMPDTVHCVDSSADGKSLVGNLPCAWESLYVRAEYLDARETPFEIAVPRFIQSSLQIEVPTGYRLAGLERLSGSGRTKFAAWTSRATQQGNVVSMEYGLRLAAGRHSADAYGQYYADMIESLSALHGPVTLHENVARTAGRPATVRPAR